MLIAAAALASIVCFVIWFFRRRSGRTIKTTLPIYVLLHNGRSTTLHVAERTSSGSFLVSGSEFPPSLAVRVDDTIGATFALYLIAIEPVALVEHQELERVRFGILVGNIFKPAGDIVQMLRIIGAIVIIAVGVFTYMEVSGLQTSLNNQMVETQKITDRLKQPFVVAPAPAPTEVKK